MLFQFESILKGFSDPFGNPVIAVRVRIKGYGVDKGHINFVLDHNSFIGGDINDFTDDPDAVFIGLLLDKLTLQTERKFYNDGCVYQCGLFCG